MRLCETIASYKEKITPETRTQITDQINDFISEIRSEMVQIANELQELEKQKNEEVFSLIVINDIMLFLLLIVYWIHLERYKIINIEMFLLIK